MDSTLYKIRKVNKLFQNLNHNLVFEDICNKLSNFLTSSVLIVDIRGNSLGYNSKYVNLINNTIYIERLNSITETREINSKEIFKNKEEFIITVIPIIYANNRQGTLLMYKENNFSLEDIIVSEHISTIIGLEIFHINNQIITERYRKSSIVKCAINTLSYSELEAIVNVFNELNEVEREGLIVASKVAERWKMTRSVIVNALRKLESADIIESRSLGMKGTYIKVLNELLFEELKKLKR